MNNVEWACSEFSNSSEIFLLIIFSSIRAYMYFVTIQPIYYFNNSWMFLKPLYFNAFLRDCNDLSYSFFFLLMDRSLDSTYFWLWPNKNCCPKIINFIWEATKTENSLISQIIVHFLLKVQKTFGFVSDHKSFQLNILRNTDLFKNKKNLNFACINLSLIHSLHLKNKLIREEKHIN